MRACSAAHRLLPAGRRPAVQAALLQTRPANPEAGLYKVVSGREGTYTWRASVQVAARMESHKAFKRILKALYPHIEPPSRFPSQRAKFALCDQVEVPASMAMAIKENAPFDALLKKVAISLVEKNARPPYATVEALLRAASEPAHAIVCLRVLAGVRWFKGGASKTLGSLLVGLLIRTFVANAAPSGKVPLDAGVSHRPNDVFNLPESKLALQGSDGEGYILGRLEDVIEMAMSTRLSAVIPSTMAVIKAAMAAARVACEHFVFQSERLGGDSAACHEMLQGVTRLAFAIAHLAIAYGDKDLLVRPITSTGIIKEMLPLLIAIDALSRRVQPLQGADASTIGLGGLIEEMVAMLAAKEGALTVERTSDQLLIASICLHHMETAQRLPEQILALPAAQNSKRGVPLSIRYFCALDRKRFSDADGHAEEALARLAKEFESTPLEDGEATTSQAYPRTLSDFGKRAHTLYHRLVGGKEDKRAVYG